MSKSTTMKNDGAGVSNIDNCYTEDELIRAARAYAKEFLKTEEAREALDIDLSIVTFEVSTRMTRAAGKAIYHPDGTQTIRISWKAYQGHSVDQVRSTIRHELIHVNCAQNDLPTGHGPIFKLLAEVCDCEVHCPRFVTNDEAKYLIECEECELVLQRHRKSKLVKQTSRFSCGNCGGRLRQIK